MNARRKRRPGDPWYLSDCRICDLIFWVSCGAILGGSLTCIFQILTGSAGICI